MFIGYPRSSHSLVGAILDAHPEIIIPHEYDIMRKWEKHRSSELEDKNLRKYQLFYDLHHLSLRQAIFGIRANNSVLPEYLPYRYHVPGLWQGEYQNRIKVRLFAQISKIFTQIYARIVNNYVSVFVHGNRKLCDIPRI